MKPIEQECLDVARIIRGCVGHGTQELNDAQLKMLADTLERAAAVIIRGWK